MTTIKQNSLKAWILAARPKTLAGAAVPVLLGASLAYADGHFQWIPTLVCFAFAFLMQIVANFINDLFDFLKGSDRSDRLGPKRACAQGWITTSAMKKGIVLTTLLACIIGCTLLYYAGWQLIPIGFICVLAAYLYTGGSYPLAYHGWGDLLVFVFFGLIPVGYTYYIQAHTWTWQVLQAAAACGLVIDTLLVVNNYRDRDTDATSGKHTVIVLFGERFGRYLYWGLGAIASLSCLSYSCEGNYLAAWLPQLYLIPHTFTWRKMVQIHYGKALNTILGETSRNILLFGLLLAIGLAFG